MNRYFLPILLLMTALINEGCKSQNNIVINGYLCPEVNYQIDTFLIERKTYNDNLELIDEISYSFQEDKLNSIKRKFDETGKMFYRESFLQDSTFVSIVEFKRNSKGDIEKQIITTKGQKYILIHINEYNQNGKLYKSTIVPEALKEKNNSYPNSYSIYSYDLKGNLTNLKQYTNDSLILNDIYKYDEQGNKVEELSEITQDGSTTKTIFYYNKIRKVIKQENYVDNRLVSIIDIEWEDKLPKRTFMTYKEDNYKETILYKKE